MAVESGARRHEAIVGRAGGGKGNMETGRRIPKYAYGYYDEAVY